ncbi:uncharacterized protein [Epargyreus clarus]|uniref:uncharacterized protein n=1 Tax=Epargyreus clarus TaxID=520877 RepID=UPI003C30D6A3
MECSETDLRRSPIEKTEVEESDSSHNFQKFIYELFDKNGILHDLRAYLRGHIVNVLKCAQTGEPPLCQKHFTQRLELASQALNILIAEYLIRLEFTYSLSVFVSEIPLSNMVFDFAKTLHKDSSDVSSLRFKENDIWSVLNYLGVKCDSEHALNIVEMYRSEDQAPLLLCILKCIPMYWRKFERVEEENTSQDNLTSSSNSLDTLEERKSKIHRNTSHEKCRHYAFCKSCQNRILKLKEKCRKNKKHCNKSAKKPSVNPVNVENFMKNINVMEKSIINEMFEQLKTVYEAEVDMVKQEEENRVKRTLASHTLQLQKRREELEESLKTREAELEANAQEKKQFLWGVARALRERHAQLARAMAQIQDEKGVLAEKENNLKTRLQEAEETLRKKGEDMRKQISNELAILEGHLETMKRERDSLNKQRSDLENLKTLCDNNKVEDGKKEKEDLKGHYIVLKDELAVLKKYIESTKVEPKCVIERSTTTEFVEVPSHSSILNNTHSGNSRADSSERDVRPPNQVVNDLKKQKNVNFSQSHLEDVYNELNRERSRSSGSSEGVDAIAQRESNRDRDVIQRLIEENESLKDYTRQQRDHISALWSERVRNISARPRTAPAGLPAANYFTIHGVNPSTSVNTFGWRKGAGEELSLFTNDPPRILVPGDPLPFVGMLRDRHADNRRHLINQWRALKRRSSPLAGICKPRAQIPIQRNMGRNGAGTTELTIGSPPLDIGENSRRNDHITVSARDDVRDDQRPEASSASKTKPREKSPKTVLKEAKRNLRNKNYIKEKPPQKREKSPNSMLREAKMRLRKLEIEAEAVERSYRDFRIKQEALRNERESLDNLKDGLVNDDLVKNLDVSRSRSFPKINDNIQIGGVVPSKATNDLMKKDFQKYLLDYQTKFDIGGTHFKNKNTALEKLKPIPSAFSEVNAKNKDKGKSVDYLETPMMQFRKMYHAEKERTRPWPRSSVSEKIEANRRDLQKDIMKQDKDNSLELEISRNTNDINNAVIIRDTGDIRKNNTIIINDVEESNSPNTDMNYTDHESKSLENKQVVSTHESTEFKRSEALRKIKNNKAAELELLKENINKMYNLKPHIPLIIPLENDEDILPTELDRDESNDKQVDDNNILRVEVENTCEASKIKMFSQDDLLIIVESSANTKESDGSEEIINNVPPMTVTVSPRERSRGPKDWKDGNDTPKSKRSESPEQAAQLTRNDVLNAIFQAEDKDISSVDMQLDSNVKDSSDEKDFNDYPDDFSADVDNYNSRSEYGNNSPISLPKTSEDENFWDN